MNKSWSSAWRKKAELSDRADSDTTKEAPPWRLCTEIRERRHTLRYRNLMVRQAVQMKNKIAALLMEAGVSYNKQKLHKVGYFRELLPTNQDIDEGLRT